MSEKKKIFEIKHFVAGEISGMIGATICHPCDTIKTKIQMNRNTKYVIISYPTYTYIGIQKLIEISHSVHVILCIL